MRVRHGEVESLYGGDYSSWCAVSCRQISKQRWDWVSSVGESGYRREAELSRRQAALIEEGFLEFCMAPEHLEIMHGYFIYLYLSIPSSKSPSPY